jgi:hypothetical protein
MRELTSHEIQLCEELGLDIKDFGGKEFGSTTVVRRDGYQLVERCPEKLTPEKGISACIDALELSHNLRFGNLMVSFANAWHIAQRIGVNRVFFPENPLFRARFVVGRVEFSQEKPLELNTLRGRFFYSKTFKHHLQGVNRALFWSQTRTGVIPLSNPRIKPGIRALIDWIRLISPAFTNSLTIHLRSGDIFEAERPHPGYAQPPLSFYLWVVADLKPRHVTLVFENLSNPVIGALIQELSVRKINTTLVNGPIGDALTAIYKSKVFVGAVGSFSLPVLAMAPSPCQF